MKLIIWFGGLGMCFNESLYFLQLTLISSLKSWRVIKDELWVALKEEWAIYIMDTTLISGKAPTI